MSVSKVLPSSVIPSLEPGDRLSREEFERRYEAMPNIKKAELIEGVVYMPSPVRKGAHGKPHGQLLIWLGHYQTYTPGVEMIPNGTIRLDQENEPQPDAMLLLDPKCGGQSSTSADDYVEGAPEFVAEVSSSTVSFDLHAKKAVYRRTGVREYLVWRVLDQQIDWFISRGRKYISLAPDKSGILRSAVFPGLWLDPAALIRGDGVTVLKVLQQGMASPEYDALVQKNSKQMR